MFQGAGNEISILNLDKGLIDKLLLDDLNIKISEAGVIQVHPYNWDGKHSLALEAEADVGGLRVEGMFIDGFPFDISFVYSADGILGEQNGKYGHH